MTVIEGALVISKQSIKQAMTKVKELTPRGTHLKLEETIQQFNKWYTGWASYYNMTQYPTQLRNIEAHFRRRIRSRLIDQQKKRRNLFNTLIKRDISRGMAAKAVFSNKRRWALSITMAINWAYPKRWFNDHLGQVIKSREEHPHWFSLEKWIQLT